jgi:polysaccharide pyruvyl transferase WcaK-like protein
VAADVLRAADYVSVRDDASASLARDVGVDRRLPVAPDPGWSAARRLARLDLPAIDPALAGKRVLAVNLRRWPFDADWEERFANAFRGALPDGWVALWIDFQRTPNDDGSGYVDDEIASRMIQRLAEPGRHVLLAPANMREAMDALVSCDAVLGMRLHAALLGVAAGLPVLSLEYDDKVGAMMAQAGLPAAQRIALPEIAPRLRGALHALIGHGSRPMTPSPEVRLQLAEAALLHRDILWQAMQAARARTPPAAIAMPPILSQWLDAQPALAPAIRSVLGSRVA